MTKDLTVISNNINVEISNSNVTLPDGYSPENALKSAYLILRETVDKNKKPVLDVCTQDSLQNALLDMVVQGLNPIKKQCYFVAYGTKLTLMRSYMGAQAVAKRVDPRVKDIRSEVVYEEDGFVFNIVNGKKIILSHNQLLPNIIPDQIAAAYAVAVDADENPLCCEIMVIDEIMASWRQSQMKVILDDNSIKKGSTHEKFTAEMAKRTVINRLCKQIINTSNDDALLQSITATDETKAEDHAITEHIQEHANVKKIDFKPLQEPAEPMATKQHAKVIIDLAVKLGRKENAIADISSFVGREISGISQITETEAENYIEILDSDVKNLQNDTPNWA